MMLEQPGSQIGDGVVMEVGRQIGHPNAIVRINFTAPKWRKSRLILRLPHGALQLILGR